MGDLANINCVIRKELEVGVRNPEAARGLLDKSGKTVRNCVFIEKIKQFGDFTPCGMAKSIRRYVQISSRCMPTDFVKSLIGSHRAKFHADCISYLRHLDKLLSEDCCSMQFGVEATYDWAPTKSRSEPGATPGQTRNKNGAGRNRNQNRFSNRPWSP